MILEVVEHVQVVLKQAIEAEKLNIQDAAALQTRLGCLAFNMTKAQRLGITPAEAQYCGHVDPLQATVWLFHQNYESSSKKPEPSALEQLTATKLLLQATDLDFVVQTPSAIYFTSRELQNYFCTYYCSKQPFPFAKEIADSLRSSNFDWLWSRWSAYDPSLISKMLNLLETN